MRYQYKREPLIWDEANRLANVCQNHEEELIIFLGRFEFQKQQNQFNIDEIISALEQKTA